MAVGIERDVQDVLLGQRKTRRSQGNVPYFIPQHTTDLADLCVLPCYYSQTINSLIPSQVISGTTCFSKASGVRRLYITSLLDPLLCSTSDVAQDGG